MGNQIFKFSSNPLSTLSPQFSPDTPPNYNISLTQSVSNPLYNPGSFITKNQANQDLVDLTTGTLTQNSTNSDIAKKGKSLINGVLNRKGSYVNPTPKVDPNTGKLTIAGYGLDIANNLFTGVFGAKDAYSGKYGSTTQFADNLYDTASDIVGTINPVAGVAMKAGKLAGNIADKLGGGTDAMTVQDALLDSSFMKLSPLGLINGFFGKTADTITKDNEVFATVGSSYGGTNKTVNEALEKSGKKYGLFSSGARKDANEEIAEAKRQQNIMRDIMEENNDRTAIRNSMSAFNGIRRQYYMQGGYNQSDIRVGRNGMNIELLNRARKVVKQQQKLQTGGVISDPFEVYLQSLPQAQRDSTNFRVRDYWEYNGRPKNFDEARKKGMFEWKEDFDESGKSLGWSWHAFTVAKNPNADEYDFMKSSSHPTVQEEINWYNSDRPDAVEFRKEYELQKIQPYYKYVKRKAPYKDVPVHKEGGSIIELVSLPTEILLVDPTEVPEFQNGGSIPQKVKDYYKNYNLDGITLINDQFPRTEGDTIYSPSDEFTVHEIWHWLSKNKPNESLKEFYDNLDDKRISELGGDLSFVKRTGDPGDFYSPSELESRLNAAKFMTQGQKYTKEFFHNLRKNETQYGDNMRDLLRMYNDDNLVKLFNIDNATKFQEGGSINVIPDGALHARKHNMDMEGITKKGIPVVSENKDGSIEQQAEIEKEEIIYRLEVTKKLEELEKKFYDEGTSKEEKDYLALEAGKLLVEEILYNTIDNTNNLL